MKIKILVLLIAFTVSSCGPSPEAIQNAVAGTLAALTPTIIETSSYTKTPWPTITRWPTKTPKTSTATRTPGPTKTPGPSKTPVPSNTPIPTLPPEALTATAQYEINLILYADHEPGVYLVNIDIGPGIWRNSSNRDDCYWKRSDKYGEIIDNYYGFGGGTIYIDPSDFSVELDKECDIWIYLSPP